MPHPSFFADVASIILEVIKVIKSVYLMIIFCRPLMYYVVQYTVSLKEFQRLCCMTVIR